MNLTCLSNNIGVSNEPGLKLEHGLAIYVEYKEKQFLIDCSAKGDVLVENAKLLKVGLGDVECCLISHFHWDHVGGLLRFLKENEKATVYIRRPKLPVLLGKIGPLKLDKGISKKERDEIFGKFSERIVDVKDETVSHDNGVYLFSNFESGHQKVVCCYSWAMYLSKEDKSEPELDDWSAELSFAFVLPTKDKVKSENEVKRYVVVSSCSHNGIINICKTIQKRMRELGDYRMAYVVGGFHFQYPGLLGKIFFYETKDTIRDVANSFKTEFKYLEKIYTTHCTELYGYGVLKEELGDLVQYLKCGETLEFV